MISFIMASKDFNNNEEFDIIDFDLNEYDEEFEKEAQKLKLKEAKKEPTGSRAEIVREKLKEKDDLNDPNRDMLKTILFILVIIVIACLFLGLISFIVNLSGGTTDRSEKDMKHTQISTEQVNTYNSETSTDTIKNNATEDDAKEEFEEHIEEITNNVVNDIQEDNTENKPDNPTTESPTTESTTEDTPDPPTENTTESTTESIIESSTESSNDTSSEENPEGDTTDNNIETTPAE